jgi:hypothetical protein
MNNLPNNLTPTQSAILLALRATLRNLEDTIAALLQLAFAQPVGLLHDQLMDRISAFDSIADVMRQALDATEK